MSTALKGGVKTTAKQAVIVFSISAGYLLLSFFLVGFKTDQLVLIAIFNLLFFLSPITRKFITGFSIFIVYWIIFDYMKAFPNYAYNTVHIADLYNFEKPFRDQYKRHNINPKRVPAGQRKHFFGRDGRHFLSLLDTCPPGFCGLFVF